MDNSTATIYPPPVRWLNYDGDCTGTVGRVMGPNMLGEYLTAVCETYDAAAGQTRVGFAYGIHKGAQS